MAERQPLNPWKLSGYREGELVVCKVTGTEPGGYSVHIRKDNLIGFLSSNANYAMDQEIIAQFTGIQPDQTRILLSVATERPLPFVDRTKCREFDLKIAEAKTVEQARLIANELLIAIKVEPDTDRELSTAKESILMALILNVARFYVRGEPVLRRMRDMLNVDLDTLGSLLHREPDEQQLYIDFKKVPNPLNVLDELSAQLSKIVQYPPRGTRIKV